ncbi:unnamed protein product, partial [Arctia plantaginis]
QIFDRGDPLVLNS